MADDPSDDLRTEQFRAVADWMTEDVAQRHYAARQDLADGARDAPLDAAEIDAVRCRLMAIIRSLHETAGVLRDHDAATMPADRLEALAARVERDCREAEVEMQRGLSLVGRPPGASAAPRSTPREAVRGDGPLADWPTASGGAGHRSPPVGGGPRRGDARRSA
jgi:hypothetical protein